MAPLKKPKIIICQQERYNDLIEILIITSDKKRYVLNVIVNDKSISFGDFNYEFEKDYPSKYNLFYNLLIGYADLMNDLKLNPSKQEIIKLLKDNINIYEILKINEFKEKYY